MEDNRRRVGMPLYHDICQHYYAEASFLQNRMYREWLDQMVAEDIHYWMPIREQRLLRDKRPEPTPDDSAIYNDRMQDLRHRVERLYTGQVWMEDPPSQIRYYINNVEAFYLDDDDFEVFSNVFVVRNRRQHEVTQHSFGRQDILRRSTEGFKLSKRKLVIDARVVQDKNLYFFV